MLPFNWISIALYRPQIPQNTGNIGRTCVGLNIPLYIIGKPAFFIDDKHLKRAGLDYWEKLKLTEFAEFPEFFKIVPAERCHFLSKFAEKSIFDTDINEGDSLVFGMETKGLPEGIHQSHKDRLISLPMGEDIRSYNLSNTVAAAAFEAYRKILHRK